MKAIPRNLKEDVSDFKRGIVPGIKGTTRRFWEENKRSYARTKRLVQIGVSKAKETARRVTRRR